MELVVRREPDLLYSGVVTNSDYTQRAKDEETVCFSSNNIPSHLEQTWGHACMHHDGGSPATCPDSAIENT